MQRGGVGGNPANLNTMFINLVLYISGLEETPLRKTSVYVKQGLAHTLGLALVIQGSAQLKYHLLSLLIKDFRSWAC